MKQETREITKFPITVWYQGNSQNIEITSETDSQDLYHQVYKAFNLDGDYSLKLNKTTLIPSNFKDLISTAVRDNKEFVVTVNLPKFYLNIGLQFWGVSLANAEARGRYIEIAFPATGLEIKQKIYDHLCAGFPEDINFRKEIDDHLSGFTVLISETSDHALFLKDDQIYSGSEPEIKGGRREIVIWRAPSIASQKRSENLTKEDEMLLISTAMQGLLKKSYKGPHIVDELDQAFDDGNPLEDTPLALKSEVLMQTIIDQTKNLIEKGYKRREIIRPMHEISDQYKASKKNEVKLSTHNNSFHKPNNNKQPDNNPDNDDQNNKNCVVM